MTTGAAASAGNDEKITHNPAKKMSAANLETGRQGGTSGGWQVGLTVRQAAHEAGGLSPWKRGYAGQNDRMSLQEIQKEVAQLSAEERDALRRHLDQLEFFSDDKVLEEWTRNNRDAEAGAVVSREQAIAQLKAAGKQLR